MNLFLFPLFRRHARRFSGTNLVVICPADLGWTDDTDAPRPRVFTAKAIEAAPSHESLLSGRTAWTPWSKIELLSQLIELNPPTACARARASSLAWKAVTSETYFQRLPDLGLATRSISFLPFGRSQGSSLIDHLRQRELTTAQDLNFIILPIFRKKSIMNPATLWSDSQADTFVRSFSTNFTAGTGMLYIWVMKTMHAGIFLAKW